MPALALTTLNTTSAHQIDGSSSWAKNHNNKGSPDLDMHSAACLLISRVSDAFQPAQLVFTHHSQAHTGQHISGQQRMVCGGWQGHVQGLQLLSDMHGSVNAAELLLAVCLQTSSCLQRHHTAVSASVRWNQDPEGGGKGKGEAQPLPLAILNSC